MRVFLLPSINLIKLLSTDGLELEIYQRKILSKITKKTLDFSETTQ